MKIYRNVFILLMVDWISDLVFEVGFIVFLIWYLLGGWVYVMFGIINYCVWFGRLVGWD